MRLLPLIVLFAWSLWFGGIMMLFIAVNSLFRTFGSDRTTAGLVATGIFHRFEVYQLILAAVAIVATMLWRLQTCARIRRWLLMLLLSAAVLGAAIMAFITPRIDAMRIAGTTQTADFARLHGLSMVLYLAETGLLFIAGVLLALAMTRDSIIPAPREIAAAAAPVSAPPAEADR